MPAPALCPPTPAGSQHAAVAHRDPVSKEHQGACPTCLRHPGVRPCSDPKQPYAILKLYSSTLTSKLGATLPPPPAVPLLPAPTPPKPSSLLTASSPPPLGDRLASPSRCSSPSCPTANSPPPRLPLPWPRPGEPKSKWGPAIRGAGGGSGERSCQLSRDCWGLGLGITAAPAEGRC